MKRLVKVLEKFRDFINTDRGYNILRKPLFYGSLACTFGLVYVGEQLFLQDLEFRERIRFTEKIPERLSRVEQRVKENKERDRAIKAGEKEFEENIPLIKVRLSELVTECMREQEERIGVKHFGRPNLEFEAEYCWYVPDVGGEYKSEKDTINLFSMTCDIKKIMRTLKHELGHFYADKLSESLGRGNWPNKKDGLRKTIDKDIIGEGIAEYFEGRFENEERSGVYEIGYKLVKPIIDLYGKRGIEYLISNPDLFTDGERNIPVYQKRALETLNKLKAQNKNKNETQTKFNN